MDQDDIPPGEHHAVPSGHPPRSWTSASRNSHGDGVHWARRHAYRSHEAEPDLRHGLHTDGAPFGQTGMNHQDGPYCHGESYQRTGLLEANVPRQDELGYKDAQYRDQIRDQHAPYQQDETVRQDEPWIEEEVIRFPKEEREDVSPQDDPDSRAGSEFYKSMSNFKNLMDRAALIQKKQDEALDKIIQERDKLIDDVSRVETLIGECDLRVSSWTRPCMDWRLGVLSSRK